MPPSTIMSVKQFESNRSLKLMSQKSVGKKANFGNKKNQTAYLSVFHIQAMRKT